MRTEENHLEGEVLKELFPIADSTMYIYKLYTKRMFFLTMSVKKSENRNLCKHDQLSAAAGTDKTNFILL